MSQQNILKEAKKGTRIYNQTHDIFYIHLGGGKWQRDDEFTSRVRRQDGQSTGRLNFGLRNEEDPAPTIGKDGSFSIAETGFVISDTSNPNIAESLRGMEKKRVQLRIEGPAKKAEKQKLNKYNALKEHIEKNIQFYQDQYPKLDMSDVFKKAYNSGDPAKYLLENHNIRIGQAKFDDAFTTQSGIENLPMFKGLKGGPTGMVGKYFFDSYGSLMDLEKELNINQPKEVNTKPHSLHDILNKNNTSNTSSEVKINNTGNGTNVNTNKNQQLSINQNFNTNNEVGKIVSSDTNLKGLLNNGKEKTNNNNNFENRITSNGKNGSNKKVNLNSTEQRFSWEKDLNTKQAKELQNIRNVFGDYRKELNISKRIAGSNTNRRRLTGPLDQHTAEMLGLV